MISYQTLDLNQFCLTQSDYDKNYTPDLCNDTITDENFVPEISRLHNFFADEEDADEFDSIQLPLTDKFILTDEYSCIREIEFDDIDRFWLIKIDTYYALLHKLRNKAKTMEIIITCYKPPPGYMCEPNIAERVHGIIIGLSMVVDYKDWCLK